MFHFIRLLEWLLQLSCVVALRTHARKNLARFCDAHALWKSGNERSLGQHSCSLPAVGHFILVCCLYPRPT